MSFTVEQRLADALAECERMRVENPQLREHLAAFQNPEFYRAQAMRRSFYF